MAQHILAAGVSALSLACCTRVRDKFVKIMSKALVALVAAALRAIDRGRSLVARYGVDSSTRVEVGIRVLEKAAWSVIWARTLLAWWALPRELLCERPRHAAVIRTTRCDAIVRGVVRGGRHPVVMAIHAAPRP